MILSMTQAIVSAVEHGYGLGWVSSLGLESRDARRVALLRLADVSLHRALYLVQDGRRPLPPVAAAFAEWVRHGIRDEGSGNSDRQIGNRPRTKVSLGAGRVAGLQARTE